METQARTYPTGAKVRVADICRDPKSGRPGLLPISRSTFYQWLAEGRVPAGQALGPKIRVWSVETILGLAQQGAKPEHKVAA